MAGHQKRARGKKGKVHKQIAKHFSFYSRPKGRGRSNSKGWAHIKSLKGTGKKPPAETPGRKGLQTLPLNVCAGNVMQLPIVLLKINHWPVNLGRLKNSLSSERLTRLSSQDLMAGSNLSHENPLYTNPEERGGGACP